MLTRSTNKPGFPQQQQQKKTFLTLPSTTLVATGAHKLASDSKLILFTKTKYHFNWHYQPNNYPHKQQQYFYFCEGKNKPKVLRHLDKTVVCSSLFLF